MLDSIKTMISWMQLYYADLFFLILTIVSYIYLFITNKKLRVRLLLPVGLIFFCVVNPVLYFVVLRRTVYWRLFWMIPDAMILATAAVSILKRCKKDWLKLLLLLAMTAVVVSKGSNVFINGNFTKVENWAKLPQQTLDVCDAILELDDTPKAIFPRVLYSEVRQYAPEIEMMYGRNADGFIYSCPMDCLLTRWQVEQIEPDYDFVFSQATRFSYNIVVAMESKPASDEFLMKYQFEEAARTSGYIVYFNRNIV